MILVTTAGKVGAEAARSLAQDGTPVRVLVRDPEKATALTRAGADVLLGDLNDRDTLDLAMPDVQAVILVSPAVPDQEIAIVDSAARAGVSHVVKITSKASADSPVSRRRDQAEIEARLIASGLGYALLRNNAYMQNFLMLSRAIRTTSSFSSGPVEGNVNRMLKRQTHGRAGFDLLRKRILLARTGAGVFHEGRWVGGGALLRTQCYGWSAPSS